MKFGAHLSISKGLPKLLAQAEGYGMDAVQIFARNPRGRGETKVPADDAKAFREELKKRGWTMVIHAPYYVNIGSGVDRNRRIASEVAAADLSKGDYLGAEYVVVHLGTPGDDKSLEECTPLAIKAVKEALKKAGSTKSMLLLETGAGPNRVGGTFEQLAAILKGVNSKRVGVCLDTCHMYVAGHDVRGAGMKKVLDKFGKIVGFQHLRVVHCNDTLSNLGSGLDRHYHLGKGQIGRETFKVMLTDKRLKDMTFILETPKEDKDSGLGDDPDVKNLALLKKLARTA